LRVLAGDFLCRLLGNGPRLCLSVDLAGLKRNGGAGRSGLSLAGGFSCRIGSRLFAGRIGSSLRPGPFPRGLASKLRTRSSNYLAADSYTSFAC
jgi:hypothetical protein